MINYDTKEWENVYSPIFKKADGFVKLSMLMMMFGIGM